MDMSSSSAILGMPFYASRFGASSLVIGSMAAASTLLYVIFSQIFGRLSDRVNRKRVPQIACICFSLLYFLMPFCRDLRQLAILFPFTGLTLSAFWPSLEAWIGERSDDRPLAKRVSIFNLFWTVGALLGFVTSGYIYDIHATAPFYFASVSALCSAIAITIQPEPVNRSASRDQSERATDDRRLTIKYMYISWAANFVSWLTLGVIRYIFPKLINELNMPPRLFGLLMLGWSCLQGLMFYILGATEKWRYKFGLLAGFQMLGCLGFLTIWTANSPRFWAVALMLFGIDTGMTYFSSIYYSLCGHADLGNKSGWHESILRSGEFIGSFTGGILANYISLKSPYLFCAAMIVGGLAFQSFILRVKSGDGR